MGSTKSNYCFKYKLNWFLIKIRWFGHIYYILSFQSLSKIELSNTDGIKLPFDSCSVCWKDYGFNREWRAHWNRFSSFKMKNPRWVINNLSVNLIKPSEHFIIFPLVEYQERSSEVSLINKCMCVAFWHHICLISTPNFHRLIGSFWKKKTI